MFPIDFKKISGKQHVLYNVECHDDCNVAAKKTDVVIIRDVVYGPCQDYSVVSE